MNQARICLLLFTILFCRFSTAQSQYNTQRFDPYPCYDSNAIHHHVIGVLCGATRLDILKSTKCSNEVSNVNLEVDGKDISGFDKFLLQTSPGEMYQFALSNGDTIFLNSASAISFNPQANFIDVHRGESYFEIHQNTKIYLTDKLILWALSGSQINIMHDSGHLPDKVDLCILKGQVKLQIGNEGKELSEGKRYIYTDLDFKELYANTSDARSWTNENFNYKSIPCDYLINQFGRWYNLPVVYKYKVPTFKLSFQGNYAEPLSQNLGRLHRKKKNVFCFIEDDKISIEYK